ncbi:hypothetical protein VMCG_00703 [Cytospora schulzeri]|uniref:Uncharacterized protein n=1 Tax=Cytospora schulzeri TaxID=448051 RepID=A0A423X8F3_9PEZI|nr:hypothetical protein VMCG_00703 [Valsa malicola]
MLGQQELEMELGWAELQGVPSDALQSSSLTQGFHVNLKRPRAWLNPATMCTSATPANLVSSTIG